MHVFWDDNTRSGTRARNLLLRREAPYPLGHTSTYVRKRISVNRYQYIFGDSIPKKFIAKQFGKNAKASVIRAGSRTQRQFHGSDKHIQVRIPFICDKKIEHCFAILIVQWIENCDTQLVS
jgi:hypothetical protein